MYLRVLRDAVGVAGVLALVAILFINAFAPIEWSVGFLAFAGLAWVLLHFAYRKKASPSAPPRGQSTKEKIRDGSADDIA